MSATNGIDKHSQTENGKSSSKDDNSKDRERWPLMVIGLPDSGKSTFIARIYGATFGGGGNAAGFSIALPAAIDQKDAKSLSEVQKLWDWIRSNFDQKLKTIEHVDLTFFISGKSLAKGLRVETRDLPGETFQPPNAESEKIIDGKELERLKNKLHKEYRYLHAAIILVDSQLVDNAENTSLVRSMIELLPNKTRRGEPLMKLVVFTKAKAAGEGLRVRLAEMEREWRKQGENYLRVLACESIADLRQGDDGKYELPAGGESDLPDWIHTPTSAILQLPAMLARYRSRRVHRRVAVAAGFIAVMTMLWGVQGWHNDRNLYNNVSQPPGRSLESLERYLVNSPAQSGNFFYPFRHRTSEVEAEWNKAFFDEHLGGIDLEEQKEALAEIAGRSIWRHVDKDKFALAKSEIEEGLQGIRGEFEAFLRDWEQKAKAHDDPRALVAKENFNQFAQSPSLVKRGLARRQELLALYEKEKQEVRDFRELAHKWRDNIEEVSRRLQQLSTSQPPSFDIMRRDLRKDLSDIGKNVQTIGLEQLPYRSRQLLQSLIGAIERQIGVDSAERSDVARIRDEADKVIRRLQGDSERFAKTLDIINEWGGKLQVCQQALDNLKDLPEAKEWESRRDEWVGRLDQSRKAWESVQQSLESTKAAPRQQEDSLAAFADETMINHAPEHRQSARERLTALRKEINDLDESWRRLEAAAQEFSRDSKKLHGLAESLKAYENLLLRQDRPHIEAHRERVGSVRQDLDRERKKVESLVAQYESRTAQMGDTNHVRAKAARSSVAELLRQLANTYAEAENHARVQRWLSAVKGVAEDTVNYPSVKTDEDFDASIHAAALVQEFAESLSLPEAESVWAKETIDNIRQKWADERWKGIERSANSEASQGHFGNAIRIIDQYRNNKEAPFAVFEREAERDIQKHAKAWEERISADIGAIGSERFAQRANYSEGYERLKALVGQFEAVRALPSSLGEARRSAEQRLDARLLEWHESRVNQFLGNLPENPDGRRILTQWRQIDELTKLFQDMLDDKDVREKFASARETAQRAADRLRGLRGGRDSSLAISAIEIETANDAKYALRYRYPRPELELAINNSSAWKIELVGYDKESSAKDSKGRTRIYNVREDTQLKRYIITAGNWGGDAAGQDRFNLKVGSELILKLRISNQTSAPLTLTVISGDETPAALLPTQGQKSLNDGTVKYKGGTLWSSDYTMKNIQLRITASLSGADAFIVPASFDGWR